MVAGARYNDGNGIDSGHVRMYRYDSDGVAVAVVAIHEDMTRITSISIVVNSTRGHNASISRLPWIRWPE